MRFQNTITRNYAENLRKGTREFAQPPKTEEFSLALKSEAEMELESPPPPKFHPILLTPKKAEKFREALKRGRGCNSSSAAARMC
jgi:hypothetical protein